MSSDEKYSISNTLRRESQHLKTYERIRCSSLLSVVQTVLSARGRVDAVCVCTYLYLRRTDTLCLLGLEITSPNTASTPSTQITYWPKVSSSAWTLPFHWCERNNAPTIVPLSTAKKCFIIENVCYCSQNQRAMRWVLFCQCITWYGFWRSVKQQDLGQLALITRISYTLPRVPQIDVVKLPLTRCQGINGIPN